MESPRRARGSRPGGGTRGRAALEPMTVAQLKAYAQERGISLSGKTIKADIIAAIKAAI
ncbi:MAG: SAP domain-containing protein [Oscillibacter sp.]|nr:SAP domain-containing protein [Oscillibacter sp.]